MQRLARQIAFLESRVRWKVRPSFAGAACLQGIEHQVQEHLLEAVLVGGDQVRVRPERRSAVRTLMLRREACGTDEPHRHFRSRRAELICSIIKRRGPREGEQLVDDALDAQNFAAHQAGEVARGTRGR